MLMLHSITTIIVIIQKNITISNVSKCNHDVHSHNDSTTNRAMFFFDTAATTTTIAAAATTMTIKDINWMINQ